MDLLLSVTGGLGRMEEMEDGTYAYTAKNDCLGAALAAHQAWIQAQHSCTQPSLHSTSQCSFARVL